VSEEEAGGGWKKVLEHGHAYSHSKQMDPIVFFVKKSYWNFFSSSSSSSSSLLVGWLGVQVEEGRKKWYDQRWSLTWVAEKRFLGHTRDLSE